jgi:hypothetical protein
MFKLLGKAGVQDRDKSELEKKEQNLVDLKKELETRQLLLEKHQQMLFNKEDEYKLLANRQKYLTTCITDESKSGIQNKKEEQEKDNDMSRKNKHLQNVEGYNIRRYLSEN